MITCAIPTGRLGQQVLTLLYEKKVSSFKIDPLRKLTLLDEEKNITYVFVKPSDVITYVESGYADIGIVGSDLIEEEQRPIYQLLDLHIGLCRLIVAGTSKTKYLTSEILNVATKFPHMTTKYFKSKNQAISIVYLKGSVELAPLIQLSDIIVDITETGTTLKENGLDIYDTIQDVSARLIVNRASYVLKNEALRTIKKQLEVSS